MESDTEGRQMNEKLRLSESGKGSERSGEPFPDSARSHTPEVPERAKRRMFTAEYKVRIVEEAEACAEPGEIGALLRREGLWSSNLSRWRRQYRAGALKSMRMRKRGPHAPAGAPLARENEKLRRQVARLERRLSRAEKLLEIQKKVSEILGLPLEEPEKGETA